MVLIMAKLDLRFGFERGVVQVTDGTMFRPLGDAIARWDGMVPPQFNFLGTDFQILYELPSDKFVIVHYPCCHNRRVNVEGKMADIWVNDAAYSAQSMKATDAVRMLIRNEFDIPKRFDRHLTTIKEEDSIVIAELAPRPISHWADGKYVGEESRHSAHTIDAVEAAREIVDFAIQSIQQLRLVLQ